MDLFDAVTYGFVSVEQWIWIVQFTGYTSCQGRMLLPQTYLIVVSQYVSSKPSQKEYMLLIQYHCPFIILQRDY